MKHYISSFHVAIEVLGWIENCTRLTQLEVEWESDEYLELDLFYGKENVGTSKINSCFWRPFPQKLK